MVNYLAISQWLSLSTHTVHFCIAVGCTLYVGFAWFLVSLLPFHGLLSSFVIVRSATKQPIYHIMTTFVGNFVKKVFAFALLTNNTKMLNMDTV